MGWCAIFNIRGPGQTTAWEKCGSPTLSRGPIAHPDLYARNFHLFRCLIWGSLIPAVWACQVGLMVKNWLPMQETQETQVRSLDQEGPLQEGMATHSSILAWRIPWTEKPGGLQSTGSQRVTRLQRLSTHACILAIEPLPVPVSVHSLVPVGKMCERDLPLHLRPQPFSSPSPHAIKSAFPSVREGPPGRQWSRILATPLQPTQRK